MRGSLILIAFLIISLVAPMAAQAAYVGPGGSTGATMKFNPAKVTISRTSAASLRIVVDTKGRPVNAVQIVLSFPDTRLDCSSFVQGTAWPFLAAKSCTSSEAKIAVGTDMGATPFVGKATAATVTFKPTQLTGISRVKFAAAGAVGGGCLVVSSSTNTDILGPTNVATITVT
jgi:hypothetical protein